MCINAISSVHNTPVNTSLSWNPNVCFVSSRNPSLQGTYSCCVTMAVIIGGSIPEECSLKDYLDILKQFNLSADGSI